VLGDLPSSAMKAAGEPIVARLDNEIVGKAAVTAATEAVNHARQRIDMVRPSCSLVPREDIFWISPGTFIPRRRLSFRRPSRSCLSTPALARRFRRPSSS
jgi:hypothetical protein